MLQSQQDFVHAHGTGGTFLNSTTFARHLVELAADKQAEDIVLLDLAKVSVLADYFIIATANSERQIKAITDYAQAESAKDDRKALHVEGDTNSGWVLLDYGDVVVHVMSPTQRAYYRLEELWRQAPMVLKIQ